MQNSKELQTFSFSIKGLNHLALIVLDIALAKKWFVETLNLPLIEDRGEMFFVRAGNDVMAFKTPHMAVAKPEYPLSEDEIQNRFDPKVQGVFDHYGFFAQTKEEVDEFAKFLKVNDVLILKGPYDRKDGRAVYFKDPLGFVGEYLFFCP